jgi:hypothetical protein
MLLQAVIDANVAQRAQSLWLCDCGGSECTPLAGATARPELCSRRSCANCAAPVAQKAKETSSEDFSSGRRMWHSYRGAGLMLEAVTSKMLTM